MKKIISVFQRNYDGDRLIRNEVVPGAEWVLAGEGRPTRKYDGSACSIIASILYKRYDAKKGKEPPGFIAAQGPDPVTGHHPGWLKVGDGPGDRWFREAWHNSAELSDGTYEACGPHFQGNPEGFEEDILVPHGAEPIPECPRDFHGIQEFLRPLDIEGIVFWHPDGRMAKVKKKDYGMHRQVPRDLRDKS
jgi:hypothetical protein